MYTGGYALVVGGSVKQDLQLALQLLELKAPRLLNPALSNTIHTDDVMHVPAWLVNLA